MLAQIIFEQEGKGGQSLLPITFLRQLIRFYGSSMQMLVPSYLEFSLDKLTNEQSEFTDRCSAAFGAPNPFAAARPMFTQMEEQSRQNIADVPAGALDVHALRRSVCPPPPLPPPPLPPPPPRALPCGPAPGRRRTSAPVSRRVR